MHKITSMLLVVCAGITDWVRPRLGGLRFRRVWTEIWTRTAGSMSAITNFMVKGLWGGSDGGSTGRKSPMMTFFTSVFMPASYPQMMAPKRCCLQGSL